MASPAPILQALRRYPGLDPKAVLAVAAQEGLSGRVGDNGHAFGPFQLNNAGGVLTGRFQGQSPQQINQWAWSPQGINYALQGIARVAGGKRGPAAVDAIVRQFERPADPNGEVARALGGVGAGGGAPLSAGTVAAPGSTGPNPFASALLSAISPTGQLEPSGLLAALQQRPQANLTGPPPTNPTRSTSGSLASVDGVQVDPRIAGEVGQVVKQFGVTPTSGYRSASHNAAVGGAENSDHLRGDAVDFGGTPQQLQQLYRWAQAQHFPYLEPMAQARNHVHISFRR